MRPHHFSSTKILLLAVILLACVTVDLRACTVCFNGADSAAADSLNGAIFMMLAALGLAFSGVGFFIYTLYKRATTPLPDHLALTQNLSEEGARTSC